MLVHYFLVVLCVTLFTSAIHLCFICIDGSCFNVFILKRLFISSLVSLFVATWGLKRKSLVWSGAISGFFTGLIVTFSSYCFLACLLALFYLSSKVTNYGARKKKKFETDFKEGGQRNWIQVICNGGVAVELALLYCFEGGVGESALDFRNHWQRSWLAAAVLSALAGATGDTWASELGTVLSKSEPRLITSFKKVPVGTNGGVTLCGLLFSALGGLSVGASYFIALLLCGANIEKTHQGSLLIGMGLMAGVVGSLFDSVVGATLQYSGLEMRTGRVVERPDIGVQHISGRPLLNNHSVNLIMCMFSAVFVPTVFTHIA